MLLPVPPKFFPPVKLNEEDEAHLRRLAKEKLRGMQDLLQGRYSQTMNWVPCEEKGQTSSLDGPQVMKTHFIDTENTSQRPHACMLYRSTIVVNASFSEVMNAIASCKTDEYRKQMRGLYGADFVDGVCLHKLPHTKQNRPAYFYTALKWCVLQPPSKVKGLGSDFCFLEYAGIHKETEVNEKMGFCIQQSVSMDSEVPDFAHYGLQRDTFQRTGLLVTATGRDHTVRLTSFCQIQNARLQPAHPRDLELMMFRRVAAVRDFAMYLERGRLGKMQFVERWRWIPDTDRRTCAVCLKMFLFRRKHHCRQCGEVVCNMCSPHREIDATNIGLTRVRICTICMMRARSDQAIPDDHCGSSVFTVNVDPSVVDYLQSPPYKSGGQRGVDDNDDDQLHDHRRQGSEDDSMLVVARNGYTQRTALAYDTMHRSKQAAAAAATSTTPTFARTPANLAMTPRPVLEFDDDENADSDFVPVVLPTSLPRPDRHANAREPSPATNPQHLLSFPQPHPTPFRPQQQSQLALLPYPSSFNQPSDLESCISFQTNATDDTECPYATHNYGKLMNKLQPPPQSLPPPKQPPTVPTEHPSNPSSHRSNPPSNRSNPPSSRSNAPINHRPTPANPSEPHEVDNLSNFTLQLQIPDANNAKKTAVVTSTPGGGTTIYRPAPTPVVEGHQPPPHHHLQPLPPTLTDSMKASLLARQALLKSRERSESMRPPQPQPARSSKVRSLSHQDQSPHQLPQRHNSAPLEHNGLVHHATLAFARLNQRPAPSNPPTHNQAKAILALDS